MRVCVCESACMRVLVGNAKCFIFLYNFVVGTNIALGLNASPLLFLHSSPPRLSPHVVARVLRQM